VQKAAQKAAERDVFVREVDEALRQDEMLDLVKRYGLLVIVLIVAALLALGIYLWRSHSAEVARGHRGEQFVTALDKLDADHLDTADKQFAPLAQAGDGGSATAARLMRADIALQQGHRDAAAKLYGQVAADAKAPQAYRDLATIRQVAASFDSMQPQQVVDRLRSLAAPGGPWFGVAGELVGMAYLKEGKKDLAGALFAKIARDEDEPDSLRRRARQMAGLLGVDTIDNVTKALSGDADATAAAAQQ
jgi:hypothetical protein